MNSNGKNSKVDNDAKNRNPLESITKESSSRRSGIPRHKSHSADAKDKSQLGDKKIGPGVSTVTTKGESSILASKNPQIHESKRRCPEQFRKAASKTVRNPSSPSRQDTKYSRVLNSSEKSTALDSCKRQSALKSKKDTRSHDSKSNRNKSLPRAKEAPCAIIAPSVERDPRRELKYGDSEGRRGAGVKPAPKETEKVDKKPGVHDLKKCPDKIDGSEKIKPVSKQIKNNANNSGGIVEVKRTRDKETSLSDNGIDAEATTFSGAARTRIFKFKERTRDKDNANKLDPTKSSSVKKQIEDEQGSKTINLTNCTIRDEKMVSLYQGDLKTVGSSSDCNRSKESGETLDNSEAEGEKINSNSAAKCSEESCEQKFPRNIEIDSSQPNVIDDSAKRLNEIGESSTVAEILQSDYQDKVTTHAHSVNDEHHSGQKSPRTSNQQAIKKYLDDTTSEFTDLDKSPNAVNDDEKYNLMKALIHSPIETELLKGDNNDRSLSLLPNHGSGSVITSKGNEFRSCCTISSSIADVTEQTSSLASSTKPSDSHCNGLDNCESWNPHASEVYLKQPVSNTSDYITMNSKMKVCKHAKKYRHYKHEEKIMCCSVARYVKQMVADERRYQGIGRRETPEREELKIIIDENSPKTSKIRIVNDRSSVSVVCHSLERIGSSGKNNTAATKKESSGGESSGYKSFHNDSTTKTDGRNKTEDPAMMSHDPKNIYVQYHNPSIRSKTPAELLCNKPTAKSSENNFNSLYVDDPVNAYAEHLGDRNDVYGKMHKRQNLEVKYNSYDTKDYLSTFTNCMDVYLPCEITAYQVEERKESGMYQLNNNERLEKDVDDAELNFGKYLEEKKAFSQDDISDDDEVSESSGQLDSEDDFDTPGDEVLVMKKPDNREYESQELIVSEQLADPHSPVDSTNIPAVPAHHRIVTSPLNIMTRSKTSEPSDTSTNTSHAKYSRDDDISVTNVKSSNVEIQTSGSNTSLRSLRQEPTEDIPEEPRPQRTRGRHKNERENLDDSNTVQELWTNKKTTTDSTDDDLQTSRKSHGGERDRKKHGTNRFKFNVFKKLKSSASEKTVEIPIDQLPKPASSVLENSAPSNSTVIASTVNSDPSRSTFAEKSQISSATIRRESSVLKLSNDTAAIQSGITQTDAVSIEDITQANPPGSTEHQDTETHPEPFSVPKVDQTLLPLPQGMHVPPPASALPPPYPFCCPMAPYMMQYWQNNQQPQPPDANWNPASTLVRSEPPPPGMVPIPWFPPMMHFGNPALSMLGPNSEMSNNMRAQPPARESTVSRGYAPCLPCSKTPESHLRQTDSMSYDGDEAPPDSSDKKQDVKKKKVSNKLFNIFRRRDRPDADTAIEEDKQQAKRRRSRLEPKSNNVQVADDVEQNLEDRSIWDSPDIAGIVTPEEIGRCFRRGFRADGLTLSGDNYLCAREPSDTTSEHEDIFNFSDHDTPLDFLLALGFSVDEATAAIRDDDVRSRFKAALTEARIWVPHIATTQGTLLYLLAMKAKPKVMRYFLQLVESIVNKRITNAVKLDAYLKILEKVEDGYVSFVTLFGKDSRKDDEEDTVIVEKQRRRIFYTIYRYAEAEAQEVDRPLTKASVDLLHSLAARYRSAIGPHLRLLASYIGEGLLTKDVQLEAALIYLSRLDSADVKLADLEKYCGLPPSERRRLERIEQTESAGN